MQPLGHSLGRIAIGPIIWMDFHADEKHQVLAAVELDLPGLIWTSRAWRSDASGFNDFRFVLEFYFDVEHTGRMPLSNSLL